MKKIILFALFALLITACSNKWEVNKDYPEDYRLQEEADLQDYLTALKEDPTNTDLLLNVAYQYQILGHYSEAVKVYKKMLEQNENDSVALNNLADIYEQVGEYEDSAEYIKKLYALEQTNIEVIKDTVRILIKAGEVTQAQEALDNFKKNKLSPENPDPGIQELIASLQEDIDSAQEVKK